MLCLVKRILSMSKRFFIFVLLLVFVPFVTHAQTIHVNYDVSYGIFGKIGVAKAVLERTADSYRIDIKLSATGLAKLLSQGRTEQHSSKGHIKNGIMISDSYKVVKSHHKTVMQKEYIFDHIHQTVTKKFKKFKKGKQTRHEEGVLDFYSSNDLLTLYFNLDGLIKEKTKPHDYIFKTIGAERQKGKVTIHIPKKKELSKYHKTLGTNASWYATAIIHQQIFSSKEGKLMLSIAEDGITNKAILKDVIFFGDIRAVRTR
jgi:competence protein ComGC